MGSWVPACAGTTEPAQLHSEHRAAHRNVIPAYAGIQARGLG